MDHPQKTFHSSNVLWSTDSAWEMEDNDDANMDFMKRTSALHEKSIDLIGHLHVDVFEQEKLLFNGMK